MKASELRLLNLIRVKEGVLDKDVPKDHWLRGPLSLLSQLHYYVYIRQIIY